MVAIIGWFACVHVVDQTWLCLVAIVVIVIHARCITLVHLLYFSYTCIAMLFIRH